MTLQPRRWVPDPVAIADQLIEDYRSAPHESVGSLDALSTIESWQATAESHGEEFTQDDWVALVEELARRVVMPD